MTINQGVRFFFVCHHEVSSINHWCLYLIVFIFNMDWYWFIIISKRWRKIFHIQCTKNWAAKSTKGKSLVLIFYLKETEIALDISNHIFQFVLVYFFFDNCYLHVQSFYLLCIWYFIICDLFVFLIFVNWCCNYNEVIYIWKVISLLSCCYL